MKWPKECVESQMKFGQRVARLYPLLKRENAVRTPHGLGTLLQARSYGCTVLHLREREKMDVGTKRERQIAREVAMEDVRPA